MTQPIFKISAALAIALMVAVPACAGVFSTNKVENDPLTVTEKDAVLGEADAPVTIVEYASMTCGHCAHFHNETFGKIKKEYIETGKVRFVMRSLPWDGLAAAATKIMHCAPADEYHNYASAFFSTQQSWTRSPDPIAELKKVARLGGMDGEAVDKCLSDPEIHKRVLDDKAEALEKLSIRSTPTFFINKEMIIEGAQPYEVFSKKIEQALEDAE